MSHRKASMPRALAPLRRNSLPREVALKRRGRIWGKTLVLGGQYQLRKSSLGAGRDVAVVVGSARTAEGGKEQVAIKAIPVLPPKGSRGDTPRMLRDPKLVVAEAHLQALCHDHPNIATVFDLVTDSVNMYLVMELGGGGDLFDHVANQGRLPPHQVLPLIRQLMSAVAHMHDHNVAHRDIKPENIVLANHDTPLLCDFGSAVEFRPGDALLSRITGTTRNFPPEVFESDLGPGGLRYDPMALDVWSTGVVLFFMLTGRFPFDGADRGETIQNILDFSHPMDLPSSCPPVLVALLEKLMHRDAKARASMRDALKFLDESSEEVPVEGTA